MGKRTNAIITAFVVVLALAVLGQVRADPSTFPAELLAHLYRAAQLFGLEGDWTFDIAPLPWEIEVARVLAPLVALTSLILVLASGAWVGVSNVRARLYHDHVVLVGLDELGWHFASACASSGVDIVAIESDEDNPRIDRVRRLNVPVIVGDPLSSATMRRCGIQRASDLVVFLGADAANIELTVRVKMLFEKHERAASAQPLRIHNHMTDRALAHALERYPKLFIDRDLVETTFFNVDELAARKLMLDHPTDIYADAMARQDVHVVVIGATRMAREVLLQVANTAHFANDRRPKATICTRDANDVLNAILADHPGLPHALQLSALEMPPSLQALGTIAAHPSVRGVSQFVVCGVDDAESLAQALILRHGVQLYADVNAPILLHMRTSDGLSRMLESVEPEPEIPDGLYPFGTLDEILNEETVINARQDDLARAMHETFLESVQANDARDPMAPSQAPWRELPERYRRDNRHEADHVDAKLRAVGCVETDDDAEAALTDAEIERLARMEKARFLAVRYVAGWQHGLKRSPFAKITDLRPWDELADRSYDLASAAALPTILRSRAKKGMRRRCVVGITGHRRDRVTRDRVTLIAAVEAVLDAIIATHPDAAFTVMSPLAEGADRLVAQLALARLPFAQLHVPLPLPYDIYVRDFGTHPGLHRGESIEEFQALLGRATHYLEMPLKFGTTADLEQAGEAGQRLRAKQYALAGAYIVQRADEFIAIWDGNDSALEGGTAQVLSWWRGTVPESYRYPDAFFPPPVRSEPFIIPPVPAATFVATRATPLEPRDN